MKLKYEKELAKLQVELVKLQETNPHPVLHQVLVYRGAIPAEEK